MCYLSNTFEDYLKIRQSIPDKGAAAYMRVSRAVNSSKLSLVEKGTCEAIQCLSQELVIREQGLYLIFCHLNFHFPNCSKSPIDLKIELLVNDRVDRQTLSTLCASETCQDKTFKTLLQLHLTQLRVEDRISVTLNHPEFLNDVSLPNENVLGVLRSLKVWDGEGWSSNNSMALCEIQAEGDIQMEKEIKYKGLLRASLEFLTKTTERPRH
ncbi:hypothetical protein DV515_00008896 [Chloebia gouldiae]|uniref:THD domain-containing protein n=1 Tax=Chloebia gouldiae TaxID=44316 RepID=A0A3L8SFI3_CHLGU|nr:hypothetical protein DV515_00008896 [Chloebia gouldiae]